MVAGLGVPIFRVFTVGLIMQSNYSVLSFLAVVLSSKFWQFLLEGCIRLNLHLLCVAFINNVRMTYFLTHFILNELFCHMYWKTPFSI